MMTFVSKKNYYLPGCLSLYVEFAVGLGPPLPSLLASMYLLCSEKKE